MKGCTNARNGDVEMDKTSLGDRMKDIWRSNKGI